MGLYEQWIKFADNKQKEPDAQQYWNDYFLKERDMYVEILEKEGFMSGTIKELAESFSIEPLIMTGFIDGINESLVNELELSSLEEDSVVSLEYDKEKLYRNMVAAKAEWLYNLPQWDALISDERRKELYKIQKKATTVVNEVKIGRNEPCPCGSGKKYKKCCGR